MTEGVVRGWAALLLLCLLAPEPAMAIGVAATGSWAASAGSTDLVAGAGSDLPSSETSAADQTVLDVTTTTGATDTWRIDVHRLDTTWDPALHLWVQVTGDGAGAGTVTGGGVWLEVTDLDQALLTGSGDRSGITVRMRVTGLSVAVPPGSRLTSLVYTVVDT